MGWNEWDILLYSKSRLWLRADDQRSRRCSKCFVSVNLLNLHNLPVRDYLLFPFYRWKKWDQRGPVTCLLSQRESGWARIGTHESPSDTYALTHHGRLPLNMAETEGQDSPLLSVAWRSLLPLSYLSSPDLSYGFCSVLPLRHSFHFWSNCISDNDAERFVIYKELETCFVREETGVFWYSLFFLKILQFLWLLGPWSEGRPLARSIALTPLQASYITGPFGKVKMKSFPRQGECPSWGGQQQREGRGKSRPRGTETHWLSAIHPPALSASHCVTAMRGPCLSSVPHRAGQWEVRGHIRGSLLSMG